MSATSLSHKVLTGRRDRIRTCRHGAGSPAHQARECDTTRSARRIPRLDFVRARLAVARDFRPSRIRHRGIVTRHAAGMAYEAMNNAGAMNSRLIVILNDNDMSIAPPVGAMSAYLARLISGKTYRSLREIGKQLAAKLPKFFQERAERAEEFARGFWTGGTLFEELGFYYVGPIDGHNLDHLCRCWKNVRDTKNGPILVHVVTQKGKGLRAGGSSAEISWRGQVRCRHRRQAKQNRKRRATPRYWRKLDKEAKKGRQIMQSPRRCPQGRA